MPFDSFPRRDFGGGEPVGRLCPCCRQPIRFYQPVEQLEFAHGTGHGLHEMNGTYHAECAKPYLSVARALDSLSRFGG